jgi:hypothetical protein
MKFKLLVSGTTILADKRQFLKKINFSKASLIYLRAVKYALN